MTMLPMQKIKKMFEPATTFRWEVEISGVNTKFTQNFFPVISAAVNTPAILTEDIAITPFHKITLKHGVALPTQISLNVYENIKNDILNFIQAEIKILENQRRPDNDIANINLLIIQYDPTMKVIFKKQYKVEYVGSYPITLGQEANAKTIEMQFNIIGE